MNTNIFVTQIWSNMNIEYIHLVKNEYLYLNKKYSEINIRISKYIRNFFLINIKIWSTALKTCLKVYFCDQIYFNIRIQDIFETNIFQRFY